MSILNINPQIIFPISHVHENKKFIISKYNDLFRKWKIQTIITVKYLVFLRVQIFSQITDRVSNLNRIMLSRVLFKYSSDYTKYDVMLWLNFI